MGVHISVSKLKESNLLALMHPCVKLTKELASSTFSILSNSFVQGGLRKYRLDSGSIRIHEITHEKRIAEWQLGL